MENKPLQFFIALRKLRVKVKEGGVEKEKEEEVQVAVPTGRKRVSFRPFCKQVAKNTTFSEQEVAAVLNMGFATARDYVARGIRRFGYADSLVSQQGSAERYEV